MTETRVLDGITYRLIPDNDIRDYILEMADNEWDPEDFDMYGDELHQSDWELQEITLDHIQPNAELLASKKFQQDLQPRIKNQFELFKQGVSIPPLVLRGKDLLIFDGYARYHFLKQSGKTKTLGFVSKPRS